jgi:hypothetical protein
MKTKNSRRILSVFKAAPYHAYKKKENMQRDSYKNYIIRVKMNKYT